MTEMEHGAALLRIDELMDARFGTPEGVSSFDGTT
ncbi:hypothetical protein LCGC14_2897970, partial [marine sediment metagenome]